MIVLRLPLHSLARTVNSRPKRLVLVRNASFSLLANSRQLSSSRVAVERGGPAVVAVAPRSVSTDSISPPSGLDDVLKGYLFGEKKATEVAHMVWKHHVQKGDTVVDATCGNGYDTLAMAKMLKSELVNGCVYGMDIQEDAIKNTSSLLDMSLDPTERNSVKLISICHSRMAEVLPTNSSVRLVAFNLGYLPGGDKQIITKSCTTQLALETSRELVVPGGVISVVAYVGHPGGREEYESVRAFASQLPAESWACSQIQMLNKPMAPVLVFLFKR